MVTLKLMNLTTNSYGNPLSFSLGFPLVSIKGSGIIIYIKQIQSIYISIYYVVTLNLNYIGNVLP